MTEKNNPIPYDKLVRDKIPEIIKNSDRTPECRVLEEDEEYTQYLIRKLQEEILEFMENPCVEELADIREVVDSLSGIQKFQEVVSVQEKKRIERGGFDRRILLTGIFESHDE
jgi:predicted house-cleaning noncanonical NTP pyrophosphatase (MazG superfamily)